MIGFDNTMDAFVHVFIAICGGVFGGWLWILFDKDDSKNDD